MATYEIVVNKKTNKLLSIYIEGIIVHCKGAYFELSIAGKRQPGRKDIRRLLKPLEALRNGNRFVVSILQIVNLRDFSELNLRKVAPGFTITYK